MRFRKNLERIGEIFAYEISKTFKYKTVDVTTPLGIAQCSLCVEQPVIGSILRAGLPMHNGMLNYLDKAQNAFVSAYRKHHKDGTFDIQVEYVSGPDLSGRTLILADPMLATGASMVLTYKALLAKGIPDHTHFVSIIGSTEGLDYAKRNLPPSTTIWIGEIDDELTAQSYIVPGLGDAGDLAFGMKV
jgi:uracil phosphoribosyltransferase